MRNEAFAHTPSLVAVAHPQLFILVSFSTGKANVSSYFARVKTGVIYQYA